MHQFESEDILIYLLRVFTATSEQAGRFNPEVSNLLFVSVDDGDAVLSLDGLVGLLLGLAFFLASRLALL